MFTVRFAPRDLKADHSPTRLVLAHPRPAVAELAAEIVLEQDLRPDDVCGGQAERQRPQAKATACRRFIQPPAHVFKPLRSTSHFSFFFIIWSQVTSARWYAAVRPRIVVRLLRTLGATVGFE